MPSVADAAWVVLAIVLGIAIRELGVPVAHAQQSVAADAAPASDFTTNELADFRRYVAGLKPRALAAGVSEATYRHAFAGVTPDARILQKPKQQPELERPIWDYLQQIVSEKRFNLGKEAYATNRVALQLIERAYGVPANIVAAVWGVESMYGTNTGQYNVVRSLATLGWRGGRRARFGEQQLLAALRILEHGDITPEAMTGSWAGAMGHTQFIPTTYEAYAVDFDHDGRRDIWSDPTDAVASAAYLLKKNGWHAGEPWGYEVRLPRGFEFGQAGLATRKPLADWHHLGVKRVDGQPLGRPDWKASVLLPAGAKGPALLVFGNFRALLRYNNSVSYGLAVAWLAQKLIDAPFITVPWPVDERPLQLEERKELQRLLLQKGYALRASDGILGAETISAVRAFQRTRRIPADGFPTLHVLEELRIDQPS
jgi:membrane-bound lytic murein transglycosylase B